MLQWKSARGTRKMYNQENWPWPYSMHKSLLSIVSKAPISLYLMNFVSPFSMINDFNIVNWRMEDVDPVREEEGKKVSLSTSFQYQTPYIPDPTSGSPWWWTLPTLSRLDIWRLTFDKYKLFIGNILINRYAIKYESDTRFRSHSIYFLLVDNTLHLIKSLKRLCPSQEDQGTHKYIT